MGIILSLYLGVSDIGVQNKYFPYNLFNSRLGFPVYYSKKKKKTQKTEQSRSAILVIVCGNLAPKKNWIYILSNTKNTLYRCFLKISFPFETKSFIALFSLEADFYSRVF